MSNWHVGMKVVCVDDSGMRSGCGEILPKAGQVYTVRAIATSRHFPGLSILLEEIVNPPVDYMLDGLCECGFRVYRFRPLDLLSAALDRIEEDHIVEEVQEPQHA